MRSTDIDTRVDRRLVAPASLWSALDASAAKKGVSTEDYILSLVERSLGGAEPDAYANRQELTGGGALIVNIKRFSGA